VLCRVTSSLAVAAAVALLGGCAAVGPNYARPDLQAPAAFRFVDGAARAESLADLPWWQVFDDAALQALIRDAIANNLDLRAAVARVEQARAQAGIAKSFLYPQLDAAASYTAQQNSADGDVKQSAVYGFQLSWELDLFGRIRRQHEASLALVLASDQARRGVIVTLVGDIASAYFFLRELDLQLDIARRTLKINDETVAYFQNRLDGGVSNRLEVDQVRSNRQQTAASIPDIEQRIALTEHALSLLAGRPPSAIVREMTALALPLPPAIPPGLPAALLERRPDVVQAEQLLVAANADVGAARALFFPTVTLTGFQGGVSGDLVTLLGSGGVAWSAGSSLLQPVFNAGRNRRNLDLARARFDEALADYRKAALNGYREVADGLVTIQKLAAGRAERQTAVAVLQDSSELARSRYDVGIATSLEILIADQQLFQQQLLLAQTVGAEFRARAELYRALGGGWQP